MEFSQSAHFWGLISDIRDGGGSLTRANQILNDLYGHPEGNGLMVSYRNLSDSEFKLKEFKLEQIGYAFAANPVLPTLFAWAGTGPTLTLSYKNIDFFGGYYWAKYVSAASTDLIDRPLFQSDELSYFGIGFNFIHNFSDPDFIPVHLELQSKHAHFSSRLLGNDWISRFNLNAVGQLSSNWSVQTLLGPQPVPHYESRSMVWDYLWANNANSDLLCYFGAGIDFRPSVEPALHLIGGFYGGYFGGGVTWLRPTFNLSLLTYGQETTSAFQSRELRLYSGQLRFML